MVNIHDISNKLTTLKNQYPTYKFGIAGSYATNKATANSDIDIVIDGDSTQFQITDTIKESLSDFLVPVDILWLDLLKEEDEELDRFAKSIGLEINKESVYKTVIRQVIWL